MLMFWKKKNKFLNKCAENHKLIGFDCECCPLCLSEKTLTAVASDERSHRKRLREAGYRT